MILDSLETIDDLSPLLEIKPSYLWIWIVLSIFVIIVIIISILYWLKHRSKSKTHLSAFEKLQKKLAVLNPQNKNQKVKPFCFELSFSLRNYLSSTWNIDAAESTSHEFLLQVKKISPEHYDTFKKFCTSTDFVKFAKKTLSPLEMLNLWKTIKKSCQEINRKEELKQKERFNNV